LIYDELGRIRKTTLDFGGEKYDKISVLTKEQREIIEKLGFAEVHSFRVVAYTTLKVRL
jgi:hypothetical protein